MRSRKWVCYSRGEWVRHAVGASGGVGDAIASVTRWGGQWAPVALGRALRIHPGRRAAQLAADDALEAAGWALDDSGAAGV